MLRPLSHFAVTVLLLCSQAAGMAAAPQTVPRMSQACCCDRTVVSVMSTGCCCRIPDASTGCCRAESRSECCSQMCACGCQQKSPPAAPDSGSDRNREQQLRLFSFIDVPAGVIPSAALQPAELLSARSGSTFYAGLSWQPLCCSWLL